MLVLSKTHKLGSKQQQKCSGKWTHFGRINSPSLAYCLSSSNSAEYLLPFMSQLVGLKEEVNETEYDESLMLIELEKKVEEVKMLSEVKDPLLDLENCSLHELISILQKFASDSSINTNQAGFGSYIANHVLKENIARYNQEAMIRPKLGDIWIPKVLVTIGKETHQAILDLGSSVSVL